ncbi:hypothetical protein DH2020_013693 [Rehmannia glutinosa]|uniref:Disease resistance R13L4/SHOC-2-like LRR domain-containing protein n=1 Tax=Rehmannia glutinosa TaxID=99300 RepID=A0ABR0X6B2_REHGL
MTTELSTMTMDEAVEEVMRIHRSLPARPGIEEVVAAKSLIQNVEREDELRLEGIAKQSQGKNVPDELFSILQEMQRHMIHFQSKKQKEEAQKLLDLEGVHLVFDEMIQRASECLQSYSGSQKSNKNSSSSLANSGAFSANVSNSTIKPSTTVKPSLSPGFYNAEKASVALSSKDYSYLKKSKSSFHVDDIGVRVRSGDIFSMHRIVDHTLKPAIASGQEDEKLSLIKLASRIELSAKKGNRELILQGKLSDQIEWLRFNRKALELVHLQELDLSSNGLPALPEMIGSLVGLKKLNVETNDIEEIPHTISRCTSLKELHADYNRLKALPEAVGRIESLEILTVRYNNIKQLPTTMASLSSLRQLDVSFNELESIPESLCFATTLVKMDVSNNFADLQSLPRSIGNLEMLEELMSNNNQIRVLPDSFGLLTRLRVLNVEGNPLVVPPRDIVEQGAQAVVRYMADLVSQRDVKQRQPTKQKKSWAIWFFSKSNKRKRNLVEYAKA